MKIVMMARNPDLYSHQRLKQAAEATASAVEQAPEALAPR